MPFTMRLWEIAGNTLNEIQKVRLNQEERLETWLANDISIVGMELLIIARQVPTGHGGRIDLLAMDREGDLVILELKRDRTPREIVAQVLDYASWVTKLPAAEVAEISAKYLQKSLGEEFADRFKEALPETINNSHSMIVVAAELDEASERIVQYLADQYGVNINVIFFNFYQTGGKEFLGRSWLLDPQEVTQRAESKKRLPWSGFWFVNVGEGEHRSWDDCKQYGFISAGGGKWYSDALLRLRSGDRIFAYIKGVGYVGYGEVTSESTMAKDFRINDRPLLGLPLKVPAIRHDADNPELCEWVIGVKWVLNFNREKARKFQGMFANQNIACKLRDERTLTFLKTEFQVDK